MKLKYTNQFVDEQILDRNIIRLSDCHGAHGSVEWKCLICDYIWLNTPTKIVSAEQGCRRCAGLMKRTKEDFDLYLSSKNITRLSEFVDIYSGGELKCNICNYIWKVKRFSRVYQRSGCPNCAKCVKLTDEIIDNKLKNRNIKRLSKYVNAKTKINVECLICSYIWDVSTSNLFSNSRGCPSCGKSLKLTNEIVDQKLLNRSIKRIGDYVNIHTKIEWQCDKGHIWKAEPNGILNSKEGCPHCKLRNQTIVFETLKDLIIFESQKPLSEIDSAEKKKYRFDFYIPQLNCAIEYNGNQHYMPVKFGNLTKEEIEITFQKQIARDQYVRDFCNKNKIELIEIDGREYMGNKLSRFVKKIIKDKIIKLSSK